MKLKKIIIIIIGAFLFLASLIYLIDINKKPEEQIESDAIKFKTEYEVENGVLSSSGKVTREITIDENNPIIYASLADIVNKIDNDESFVVYFGFSKCPWCRSVIETMLKQAKIDGIDKIYYVDVYDVRDTYILEDNEVKLEKEASEDYYNLLNRLENVLSDYTLTNENGEKVNVGEKRIYAPNVVAVVSGEAKIMKSGISSLQTDPYAVLSDEMLEDTSKQFAELFSYIKPKMCEEEMC